VHRVEVQLIQHIADELLLVGGVVDRELRFQAHASAPFPQQPGAEAVKRADPNPLAGQKLFHAAGHFVGGFIGEGDGQDSLRRNAFLDQPRDAAGDHAGLAGPRPRQHQQWPGPMIHRAPLVGRQIRGARHEGLLHLKFRSTYKPESS
jgi:hypothetical protein